MMVGLRTAATVVLAYALVAQGYDYDFDDVFGPGAPLRGRPVKDDAFADGNGNGNGTNGTSPAVHLAYFFKRGNTDESNARCSLANLGDAAYFALLGHTGSAADMNNTCKQMPEPQGQQGWADAGITEQNEPTQTSYQLELQGNKVIALYAFCDSSCSFESCKIKVSPGETAETKPECQVLGDNGVETTSFFLLEPHQDHHPGHAFCVLDQDQGNSNQAVTEIRYSGPAPACGLSTDKSANVAVASTFAAESEDDCNQGPFAQEFLQMKDGHLTGGTDCPDDACKMGAVVTTKCDVSLPLNYEFGDCTDMVADSGKTSLRFYLTAANGGQGTNGTAAEGMPRCPHSPRESNSTAAPNSGSTPAVSTTAASKAKSKDLMPIIIGVSVALASVLMVGAIFIRRRRASHAYNELGGVATYSE
jgi:hypothetical protein